MNGWEAAVEIVKAWPLWISLWLGIAIWKREAIERLVNKLRLDEREVTLGSVRLGPLTPAGLLAAEGRVAEQIVPEAFDQALDTLTSALQAAEEPGAPGGHRRDLAPRRLGSQAMEALAWLADAPTVRVLLSVPGNEREIYFDLSPVGAGLLAVSAEPEWVAEPHETFKAAADLLISQMPTSYAGLPFTEQDLDAFRGFQAEYPVAELRLREIAYGRRYPSK